MFIFLNLALRGNFSGSGNVLFACFFIRPHRELVELLFETGADEFGRARLSGTPQIFVAWHTRLPVDDADRDWILDRSNLSCAGEVRRVVFLLIPVGLCKARRELQSVFVR